MGQIEFLPFKNLSFPQGAYQNGSAMVVYNMAPVEGYGYVPFGATGTPEVISSTQLDTAARGATTFRVQTSDYIYVGTTGRLYHLPVATGVLTNVSVGGGTPYTTSSTDWGWSFTRWGNGVAATNFADDVQFKTDLTTNAAFAVCFTSTLVPKAKFMGLVKNQLMIAHTKEGGTTYPQRVRWGAVDNIFDMDESPTTQADYQDLLDDYGEITGFVGGEYGVVFKERGIYKATYVGPPLIYRFDLIAAGIGTRCPGSIIEYKGAVYFWGANAIYKLNPGGAGVDRVPEGIFKQLIIGDPFEFPSEPWPRAIKYDKSKPYLVHSAVDLALGCIYWAFPIDAAKSYVVACTVEDGRTAVADCQMGSGSGHMQWLVQGTYTGQEFTGYAPAGNSAGAFPRVCYAVNNSKRVSTHRNAPEFPAKVVSGIFTSSLGERGIITRIRPAFFTAGKVGSQVISPVSGVSVYEVDYKGAVTATRTFTASISGDGWYYGKANGPYVAIGTSFNNTGIGTIPASFLAVSAGWELEFDEIGDD